MKSGFVLIVLSLTVAGCSGSQSVGPGAERKAQCAGGDYHACAEIGHAARAGMGGTTLEQDTRFQPLSTPIID